MKKQPPFEGFVMSDILKKPSSFPSPQTLKEMEAIEAISSLALLFENSNPVTEKTSLLLISSPQEIKKIKRFLQFKKVHFPWFELPPFPTPQTLHFEKQLLQRRAWQSQAEKKPQALFLASPQALLKKTFTQNPSLLIKKGDLLPSLKERGYESKAFVEKPGDFSCRGYLFDIYSPSHEGALRIEVEDNSIQSIHLLEKDLKKRKHRLESAIIPFLSEWSQSGSSRKQLCKKLKDSFNKESIPFLEDLIQTIAKGERPFGFESLLNAFQETSSLDFFTEPPSVFLFNPQETRKSFEEEIRKEEDLSLLHKKEDLYLPWETFKKHSLCPIYKTSSPFQETQTKSPDFSSTVFNPKKDLKKNLSQIPCSHIVFVSQNKSLKKDIKKILFEDSFHKEDEFFGTKNILYMDGFLEESFYSSEGTAYLQIEEILAPFQKTQQTSTFEFFRERSKSLEFSQLEKGDLVVHRLHGVSQFDGLTTLTAEGKTQDFFVLIYQKGDKLFVPAHKAKEIKKYSRKSSIKITKHLLDRLGDPKRWEGKKSQAKKHIQAIALDLITLYKKRKQSFRPPFKGNLLEMEAFAKDFPFQETKSQAKVIEEVLSDMNQNHPMERLLCADVGFGKTEVALRASFKALQNDFQVCFLVPTTILSLQHYENFKLRFKNFPFRIGLLNRFLSKKERDQLLKDVQSGRIDFLISTHSVFTSELYFKNLGLLVIDEEHRFGVKQKERLLKFKTHLDTLSLSATPIPRTLNMAMSGMKDISVISEPPAKRKPVKTFVKSWEENLDPFIVEACEFEKNRNGQILFVHNRVKSLYQRLEHLQNLLPHLKISVAHGGMKSSELEKVILDFFEKKSDLLLSTNIIESGMDIPGANTLFIDRVHEMGLSQIYQLRGRVGRGTQEAYCYFLIPSREKLSAIAEERLSLLEKHKNLGAGFHLALHDLESRGAGSLFGADQSGHLHALGEDLFYEILNENLEDENVGFVDPEIQLPLSIGIPSSYIPDSRLRLLYYKNLSETIKPDSLEQLKHEILEDFGPFPDELNNLFCLFKIKSLCKAHLIRELRATEKTFVLSFHEKASVPVDKILESIKTKNWQMKGERSVSVPLEKDKDLFNQIEGCLLSF